MGKAQEAVARISSKAAEVMDTLLLRVYADRFPSDKGYLAYLQGIRAQWNPRFVNGIYLIDNNITRCRILYAQLRSEAIINAMRDLETFDRPVVVK